MYFFLFYHCRLWTLASYNNNNNNNNLDVDGGGIAFIHADSLQVAAVPFSTVVNGVDCLVSKIHTRCSRVTLAAIYRPPTTSKYSLSICQFCNEFGVLLDELQSLPGQLIITGDLNYAGDETHGIDVCLTEIFTLRNIMLRLDKPSFKDGGNSILDLIAHVEGSNVTSAVDVIDVGFSDHYMLIADVDVQRPKPDTIKDVFRDIA